MIEMVLREKANVSVRWETPASSEVPLYPSSTLVLHSSPPPASGGILAFVLHVLGRLVSRRSSYAPPTPTPSPAEEGEFHHWIVESFKHAFAQRSAMADPESVTYKCYFYRNFEISFVLDNRRSSTGWMTSRKDSSPTP